MAAETTTTTLAKVIRQAVYAKSALYFAERPGVANLVTFMDVTGGESNTARFPIYDKVSGASIAENTDFTTNSSLNASASVDVTVAEYAIRFIVTNLSIGATVDDILGNPSPVVSARAANTGGMLGTVIAEAIQRSQDQVVTALFSTFSSSTGSNSGNVTTTLFLAALTMLDINSIPTTPRVAVMHPKSWGDIRPTVSNVATYGMPGDQVVKTGFAANIWGVDVFVTANVGTATVSSSTTYANTIMHPSAVALAQKGPLPQIVTEYDSSLRAHEIVGTGVFSAAVYRGGATTSGRGGAGVFLYGNSTS
jgi:hypothetical protein